MRRSSAPITQPSPIPAHFPAPPTRNKLRSPRSVSAFPDGHYVYARPTSILAASQTSLTPTIRTIGSQQPRMGLSTIASTSTSSIPGLMAGPIPQPSSLLNARPIQPYPPKVEKRGFFSRLFGFGKSKDKVPTSQNPTRRPGASVERSRPVSTISVSSYNSSSTVRHRAVLVKKQPIYPVKPNRSQAISSRSSASSLQQSYAVSRANPQPTLSKVTNLGPIPESPNRAFAPNPFPYPHFDYTSTTINPGRPANPILSPADRKSGIPHNQSVPTNSGSNHYSAVGGRHTRNASYAGCSQISQDSGYQSLVTAPEPAHCAVCNREIQQVNSTPGETILCCSKICRDAATTATPKAPQTPQATCSYPECTRPAVLYPADHYWNYCDETHERYARKGCISCRKADDSGTHVCKKCKEALKQRAPTIVPVPMDHDTFWQVVDKCSESWADPTQCPIFQAARVYKVVLTQDRRDTYLGYRDTLEFYGKFTMKGRTEGNERVLWHGTRRGCYLGERNQNNLCQIPRCSLCSVIRGASGERKLAADTPTGRFGTGIYTYTKASKANDQCSNDKSVDSPWVALLLSKVAAGHECVLREDNSRLTSPPQGYDSVIGEVRGRLNSDELVVYTNDAIRPTWLVMYQRT